MTKTKTSGNENETNNRFGYVKKLADNSLDAQPSRIPNAPLTNPDQRSCPSAACLPAGTAPMRGTTHHIYRPHPGTSESAQRYGHNFCVVGPLLGGIGDCVGACPGVSGEVVAVVR